MRNQQHCPEREQIIATAIEEFLCELRRIDVLDLLAFARLGCHSAIEDLIKDAADLHFAPGFLEVSSASEADVDWHMPPKIILHLAMRPAGMSIHFTTTLSAESAHVRLTYIAFDEEAADLPEHTSTVRRAIRNNMIRPAKLDTAGGSGPGYAGNEIVG